MALGLGSGHYINYGEGRYKTAGEGGGLNPCCEVVMTQTLEVVAMLKEAHKCLHPLREGGGDSRSFTSDFPLCTPPPFNE